MLQECALLSTLDLECSDLWHLIVPKQGAAQKWKPDWPNHNGNIGIAAVSFVFGVEAGDTIVHSKKLASIKKVVAWQSGENHPGHLSKILIGRG